MTTNLRLLPLLALLVALPFALTGCESLSNTGKGATIGAGGGAVAGAILGEILGGSPAKGAIIGAAVGGTAGAVIGSRIEEQAEELDEELESASVEPVYDAEGNAAGIQLVFDNALLFDVGRSTLRPSVQADLRDLAASMQQYADHDAVIVGHASTDGSDDLNQRLSEDRAAAVQGFLRSQGVSVNRLEAFGLGEDQPLAGIPGESPENRRVEISLYPNPNYVQQVQQQQGG
ncbi:MAG: OmpA family protein [Bacteroidota bacterium]